MAFNREDADMAKAEYDADPERWNSYGGTEGLRSEYRQMHEDDAPPVQTLTLVFRPREPGNHRYPPTYARMCDLPELHTSY